MILTESLMKLTSLLQFVGNLRQASKIDKKTARSKAEHPYDQSHCLPDKTLCGH